MHGDTAKIIFLAWVLPGKAFLHVARLPALAVIRARVNFAVGHDENRFRRAGGHGNVMNVAAPGNFDDAPCVAAVAAVARAVHFEAYPDIIRLHGIDGDTSHPRCADGFALRRHFNRPLLPSPAAVLRTKDHRRRWRTGSDKHVVRIYRIDAYRPDIS